MSKTTTPLDAIKGRVAAGLSAAGASPDMEITPAGAKEAAEIVAAAMPTAAMAGAVEPLTWQVIRMLGLGITTLLAGYLKAEGATTEAIGLVVLATLFIVYRVGSVLFRRFKLTGV